MNCLQSKLLKMLKWFHEYCVDNQLQYFTVGGTTLGAMRHHGFIPWDDDIDVAMPRNDFERFLEIVRNQNGQYLVESYKDGAKDFVYPYAKIYDSTTTFIEDTQHKTIRGISIDVFPLDGIGDSEIEAKRNYKHINIWLDFLTARVSTYRKGRSLIKNFSIIFANFTTKKILPVSWILSHINKLCCKHDYNSSKYVGNLVGAWRLKEIVERTCLGNPKLYSFEDTMVYGPEKVDLYLEKIYGNWRKLPPEDKRKSTHDYILCDLEHSYLDYKEE